MAFQEIMVAPVGAKTFEEAMRVGSELHHAFRKVLDHKFGHLGKYRIRLPCLGICCSSLLMLC